MTVHPYLVGGLLASALCLTAPNASSQDDAKQAQKILKKTLAGAVKDHAQAVKLLLAPAASELKQTKASLAAGEAEPGDCVDEVSDVVTLLDFELADTTTEALLAGVSLAVDAALTAAGLPLPPAALVGTGGLLDKKLARIDRRHRSALAKAWKASRAIARALTKEGEATALRTPETPLPACVPGFFGTGPAAAGEDSLIRLPPLQFTALVGHSDGDVDGDGSLHIAGFTLLDDDVTVSGKGPDGAGFGPLLVTPLEDGTFEIEVTELVEGNWRVKAIQAVAIATDYVGIPGAPDPGTDALTPKQAAKEAKVAWKQLVKQHGKALKLQFKTFKATLKQARKEIKGGADPAVVLDAVYGALDQLQELMEAGANGPAGVGSVAAATFGETLDGLDQLVGEQLVGNGGSNDKASARIDKRLRQYAARAVKSTRGFAKLLAKKTDWRMAVDVEPVSYRRAAPVKGAELPTLVAPLRVDLALGSSQQGVDVDGIVRLRLSGDETLGPRVNLGLFGPDGFMLQDDLLASDLAAGLNLRYPEEGPGNLAEGNYIVVVSQGSVVISAAISVPGGE
jgi:hypothetical protein